jgi:hypothetical protein
MLAALAFVIGGRKPSLSWQDSASSPVDRDDRDLVSLRDGERR